MLTLDRLREVPVVALRVAAAVPADPERQVGRLLAHVRAGRLRTLVVAVHVVDERVDGRRRSDRSRIAIAARRLAEVDAPAVGRQLELGVEPAAAADRPVDLAEPERADGELDRRLASS
jgi:hypothetical protein